MEKILFRTPKKNRIKKRAKSEIAVFTVEFIILAAFALSYILAFLWAAMAGFKTHNDLIMNPFAFPETWHPENYVDAFSLLEVNGVNMLGMIGNSIWWVIGGSILGVLGPTFVAYAVTKFNFVGRMLLININIVTMTLPIIGSFPASYRMYSSLGFINSPLILITAFGAFGSTNLYMCAFFRGVSPTYAEAAKIDGANEYIILFKIMIPLSKGILIALLTMAAVGRWNDSSTMLIYLPKMPNLATGIYLFSTEMTYRARMDILMAATVLSAIPPLILYSFGHKSILTNVSLGGIKG